MANILLTETCIRRCPYCFAKEYMDSVEDHSAITWENMVYVTDFLAKSRINSISLLGGEPLIHPKAADIIEYCLKRGFNVTVFTSGIMSEPKLNSFTEKILSFRKKEINKLTFVVNVNEPRFSPKAELDKVHKFLTYFSKQCILSFNIYRLDYNLDFLIEYILEFGTKRQVRFGIANPIPGAENQYIHPMNFKECKKTMMETLGRMYELDIHPVLDCGFPACMFEDDDIGKLYKYTNASSNLFLTCTPPIDIGPDLNCWSCFPLSNYKKTITEFKSYNELASFYYQRHQTYRKEVSGIYRECDSCPYFQKICSGGCIAHILNRFHQEGNFRV